jgi:hypothetical protein
MAYSAHNKCTWDTPLSGDLEKGDMGAAGPIRTAWYYARGLGGSIHYKWPSTGSPVGTVKLELSNNFSDPVDDAASLPSPSNNAGVGLAIIPVGVAAARLRYTRSSGGAGAGIEAWTP